MTNRYYLAQGNVPEASHCGPECHQAARLDAMTEQARDDRARLLAALSELTEEVRGNGLVLRGLQSQITDLALSQARTAGVAADACATASHAAMTAEEARAHTPEPRDSLAPPRASRAPRWVRSTLAAIGMAVGVAVAIREGLRALWR